MLLKVRDIFKSHFITLILLSLPLIPLFPQNYTVKTFTTKDGLAHNNVRAIAEDSTGFLWIGTWDGLSRYDGYEFKNYYHLPGDTTSLPYFAIKSICVDGANNLWVMFDMGQLALYDRAHDNFVKIPDLDMTNSQAVCNIDIDKKGNLWIIGQENIFKRNHLTGTIEKFRLVDKHQNPFKIKSSINSIYLKDDNEIWICGDILYHLKKSLAKNNGYLNYNLEAIYNILPEQKGISASYQFDDRQWSKFFESVSGNRWLFSNNGLFKQGEDGIFRKFSDQIPSNEFTGDKLFVWGSEKSELFVYDPNNRSVVIVPPEISQHTFTYFCQNKNLFWFSNRTFSGNPIGLTQMIFVPEIFKNYKTTAGIKENEAVFALFKDKKKAIWTGVRDKDYILMINPDGTLSKIGFLTNEMKKRVSHLRTIVQGTDGIWLGYYKYLLLFYDYRTNKFVRLYPDSKYFHTILANSDGTIFIGSDKIVKYNPKDKKSEILWKASENMQIYCLSSDSAGILWAGLNLSYLLRFNTQTQESEMIKLSEDISNIEDICQGDNNDLWIAMLGGGVCNYNIITKERKFYTTSSGLSNNTTYSVLKDRRGFIWVSTNNGISRIDPKTDLIQSFHQNDGLDITEFNSDASFIAEDGEFFFGGVGGFVGFYPDSLTEKDKNIRRPNILLTDFTVSGEKKVLPKPLNELDTITLFKGENNFQLSFSSTDFINSEKTLFRYRLNDINTSWIETDSHNRNANYSNLKPGRYMFEIQATNRNGEWSTYKNIVFRITPFFYQTWLFLISVPLFIVLLLAGIIIVYIRQLKHRERQKQDALKLQSLRGQMNPHFIFNSLNSINYFISNNDKLSANRYIADFSRLIRSILSNLGSDYIPFDNELNSIKDYLNIEHLRFGDKFDFEIRIDDISDKTNLEVFPGLVQPFIENAIWHGMRALENRKGFILIKFSSPVPNRINCSVEDDGIGREAAFRLHSKLENHKSRGISIVVERLQLICKLQGVNYNLEITDLYPGRIETGTRVEIDIPAKSIKKE